MSGHDFNSWGVETHSGSIPPPRRCCTASKTKLAWLNILRRANVLENATALHSLGATSIRGMSKYTGVRFLVCGDDAPLRRQSSLGDVLHGANVFEIAATLHCLRFAQSDYPTDNMKNQVDVMHAQISKTQAMTVSNMRRHRTSVRNIASCSIRNRFFHVLQINGTCACTTAKPQAPLRRPTNCGESKSRQQHTM